MDITLVRHRAGFYSLFPILTFIFFGVTLFLPDVAGLDRAGPAHVIYSNASTTVVSRTYNGTLSGLLNVGNVGDPQSWIEMHSHENMSEVLALTLEDASGASDQVSLLTWNGTFWNNQGTIGSDSDIAFKGIATTYETLSGVGWLFYTDNDQSTVFYRTWNRSLSAEVTGPNVGGTVRMIETFSHPSRNDIIVLTLDSNRDVNFFTINSTTTSSVSELEDDSHNNFQPMNAAFEHLSGNAVLMYADDDQNTVMYRTWNGTLSTEIVGPNVGGVPRYLESASFPGTNQIALVVLDDNSDTNLLFWNGSSWGAPLEVASAGVSNRKGIGVAVEVQSRRALAVYDDNSDVPKYNVWNGSAWSSQGSAADVGGEPEWIEIVSKPFSNELLMVTQDDANDINVQVWNGSVWSLLGEITTSVSSGSEQGMNAVYTLINDTAPHVLLVSPINGNISANGNVSFVTNASDDFGLVNVTFYVDLGSGLNANGTQLIQGSGNQTSFNLTGISDGTLVTWNALFCDAFQCAFAPANFTVNVSYPKTLPNVTLLSPPNDSTSNGTIIFQANVTDIEGLANATLFTNQTGNFSAVQTAALSGNHAVVNFSVNYSQSAAIIWNVQTFDSDGMSAFAPVNFSLNVSIESQAQTQGGSGSSDAGASSVSNTQQSRGNAELKGTGKEAVSRSPASFSQSQPSPSVAQSPSPPSTTSSRIGESASSSPEGTSGSNIAGAAVAPPTSLTSIFKTNRWLFIPLLILILVIVLLRRGDIQRVIKKMFGKEKEVQYQRAFRAALSDIKDIVHKEPVQRPKRSFDFKQSEFEVFFPQTAKDVKASGRALPSRRPEMSAADNPHLWKLTDRDVRAIFPETAGKGQALRVSNINTSKRYESPPYPVDDASVGNGEFIPQRKIEKMSKEEIKESVINQLQEVFGDG